MKKIIRDNVYILQINALLAEDRYFLYQLTDAMYEVRYTNVKGIQEQAVKGNVKYCELYLQGVRDGIKQAKIESPVPEEKAPE